MKKFMNENFLLENKTARILYHKYAKKMPVIDYHCHIYPHQIAEDKHYKTITDVWLDRDHYKWRAMRTYGIPEKYVTGDASPKEKFMKWAEVLPYCIGNPLYHWTQLELNRFFGVNELLCPESAERIWNKCNAVLAREDFGVRGIIKHSNVEIICTTDDPVDSLEFHEQLKADESFDVTVLPSFRPDKAVNITRHEFCGYIAELSKVADVEITSFDTLCEALDKRLDFFIAHGCRITDHALDTVEYGDEDTVVANETLLRALRGEKLTPEEVAVYRTTLVLHLARRYYDNNIVMQIHIGALRDNNSPMFDRLGPDMGYDSIRDDKVMEPLRNLLNTLETENKLPKTVLYSLNPAHNEALMTLSACYNGHGVECKMQFGCAWWFNDQIDGIVKHLTAIGNLGLVSKFIGMLTDSRSFLSYTRHEYFRRIVCNLLGDWAERGLIVRDIKLLGKIVQDISYNNTKKYFFE